VNGIGPETADDILLYAFERPVFVIDAYTRRLLVKLQLISGNEPYEKLRAMFETSLDPEVELFKEYHALIVRHAKERCNKTTDCRHCAVETLIN
jgi:endonuclease III related protein